MGLKKHGTTVSRDILRNVYPTRPDPLSMPRSRHSFIILNCASHLTLTVYYSSTFLRPYRFHDSLLDGLSLKLGKLGIVGSRA